MTNSEDAKNGGDDTKKVSEDTQKVSEDTERSNEPQEVKESSTVQEDTVGEDSGGGGGDVINIEKMEIEKERQARETLDNYLAEAKRKMEWKEALKNANIEAANNRSDDDK